MRRWLIICIGLCALVASALLAAGSLDIFLIQHIVFEGNVRATDRQLRHLADVPNGTRLWGLSVAAVSQRLGAHPWVAQVNVSRDFPNGLRVHVVERVPVALMVYEGHLLYVDDRGEPFLEASLDDVDYPLIEGLSLRLNEYDNRLLPMVVQHAIWLLDQLDKRALLPRDQIASITFLRYRGFVVRRVAVPPRPSTELWFAFEDYSAQLSRLESVMDKRIDLRQGFRIDLVSYKGALVELLPDASVSESSSVPISTPVIK